MFAWFGKSWGAPVNETNPQTETPVGEMCVECGRQIMEGEDGFVFPFLRYENDEPAHLVFHHLCFMRTIIPGNRPPFPGHKN